MGVESAAKNTIPLWSIEIGTKVFTELVLKKYSHEQKVIDYKPKDLISKGQGVESKKKTNKGKPEMKGTFVKTLDGGGWMVNFEDKGDQPTSVGEFEGKIHQVQQIRE